MSEHYVDDACPGGHRNESTQESPALGAAVSFKQYLATRKVCPCAACVWERRHPNPADRCPRCWGSRQERGSERCRCER